MSSEAERLTKERKTNVKTYTRNKIHTINREQERCQPSLCLMVKND